MTKLPTWPTREEAEKEALRQEASCYCHAISMNGRPCGACNAAQMIRALLKILKGADVL